VPHQSSDHHYLRPSHPCARIPEAAATERVSFNWSSGSGQTFDSFAQRSFEDGTIARPLARSCTDAQARQQTRKNYSLLARTPCRCSVPLNMPSHSLTRVVVVTLGTRARASCSVSLRHRVWTGHWQVADLSCEPRDRRSTGVRGCCVV
jgi:hypothetical protein